MPRVRAMNRQEQLFTIQQVSRKLDIPRPTLRFWEKELNGLLVPVRTPGGQRRYTPKHVAIIQNIANFRTQGMSLAEIRRIIGNGHNAYSDQADFDRVDLLADQIAEMVRAEVYRFFTENQTKN